jgi:hypothetical protein
MSHTDVAISLGSDCLPAAWGKYKDFRETKSTGYLTCPFDLMVSNYEGVVKCIHDDFTHFTNPAFLTMATAPHEKHDSKTIYIIDIIIFGLIMKHLITQIYM